MYEQERAAKENAMAAVQQGGALQGQLGRRSDSSNIARELGIADKARETVGYLCELEMIHAQLREKLYGPSPEVAGQSPKSTREPSLEELAFEACQRAAMAVGEARNILSRL